ncbi:MAG TPA: ferritin-like domain-containing protein [Acidisphaera sp.]|nr:ferritin-like domain-containing protein [Acidisphaera sp.]
MSDRPKKTAVPAEPSVIGTAKIFPRNLTARAAYMVLGNPVSTRPESGVDNTHPGLEFDQRNLDRFFFPGLTVEFQFLDGARVTAIDPARLPPCCDLRTSDVGPDLYLWYVYGCFGIAPGVWQMRTAFGLDGYDVLRIVRDLERGPVMVIIGRGPDPALGATVIREYLGLLNVLLPNAPPPQLRQAPPQPPPPLDADGFPGLPAFPWIARDKDNNDKLLLAALVARRTDFVRPDGVLDPVAVPPGELTRSLCAPWQWDFADCGCHYWASNKPDIVIGRSGGEQTLNFQRDRDKTPPQQPPTDYAHWVDGIILQSDMIEIWNTLDFVINEQETDRIPDPPVVNPVKPLTRREMVKELRYLATVEHALAVEYLYAHYSIDAPRVLHETTPPDPDLERRFKAAEQIFMIAVDEMRHFRWANEALALLGEKKASLGRARQIVFGDHLHHEFKLRPLTQAVLQDFIDVEAPSKRFGADNKIDGMYTHLLVSLATLPGLDETTRNRLGEVVKLVIEEGHQHYARLLRVQDLLNGLDPKGYLRLDAATPETDPTKKGLQKVANLYYRSLLAAIAESFEQHEILRGEMLHHARRSMENLHEVAHGMAAKHIPPLFELRGRIGPWGPPKPPGP